MNVRNQVTWCYQHKHTDQQSGYVDECYQWQIQLHGSLAHIVGLWVEGDKTCVFLEQKDADTHNVTPEHSLTDDEYREPQERVANSLVAGA